MKYTEEELEKAKEDIIGIRAGLSYIYDLSKIVDKKEGEIIGLERSIKDNEEYLEDLDSKVKAKQEESNELNMEILDKTNEIIDYKKRELVTTHGIYEKYASDDLFMSVLKYSLDNPDELKKVKRKFKEKTSKEPLVLSLILSLILSITIIIYAIAKYSLINNLAKYIFLGVVSIFVIVFTLIEIKDYHDKKKSIKDDQASRLEDYNSKIKLAEDKIIELKEKHNIVKQGLNKAIKYKNDEKIRIENENEEIEEQIEELKQEINDTQKLSDIVYNSTVKNYGKTLAPEFWEKLDTVYYYLQGAHFSSSGGQTLTGCVLRQMQKDEYKERELEIKERMVNAIENYGRKILSEIRMQGEKTRNTIMACADDITDSIHRVGVNTIKAIRVAYNGLAGQINSYQSEVQSFRSEISSKVDALNAEYAEIGEGLIEAHDLTNSLLENSNRTSEELVRCYKLANRYGPDGRIL